MALRLLALAAVLAGCAGVRVVPDRYFVIDAPKAFEIARSAEVIVDLRPPEVYEQGHVPGAVSIPLNQLWFRMDELPWRPDALILAYDDDPARQARAGETLKGEGFFRVHFLRRGFAAWREAGGPVSRTPAPTRVFTPENDPWQDH